MRFRQFMQTAVAAWVLAATATAAPVHAGELQAILGRYLDREELTGGVLLVSSPHHRELAVAGLADAGRQVRVAAGSRFYVASVGKMATAVAVLQQVEEGLLSLTGQAADRVRGVPDLDRLPNFRKATIEQLLDHSSGIPDYLTDEFTAAFHARPTRLTPTAVLPFAFGLPATGRPGTGHDYSNSNYVLLGAIVASADRRTFEASLQQRVLARAGMHETTIGADPDDHRLARGYADLDDSGNLQDVSRLAWNNPLGDGPLVTTAADLERFLFALFRDGRLLKPATLARMTAASANEASYGLGVERGSDRWGRWLGHSGADDGFEAEVRYYPDRRTVLVVMVNGNSLSEHSVLDDAARTLFGAGVPGTRK